MKSQTAPAPPGDAKETQIRLNFATDISARSRTLLRCSLIVPLLLRGDKEKERERKVTLLCVTHEETNGRYGNTSKALVLALIVKSYLTRVFCETRTQASKQVGKQEELHAL